MRVAVTGGTGFVGRHVVESLVSGGYEVVVVGRSDPEDSRVEFVAHDLLADDPERWLERHHPTHIVHLAWYAEHGKFWNAPDNVAWCHASVQLARAASRYGCRRLVVAGTCAEYQERGGYCHEHLTSRCPGSLYGIAKDCTRRMLEGLVSDLDIEIAWARLFLVFGRGENRNRVVPSIVDGLMGWRKPFTINLDHYRDFLSVEDVADALVFLLGSREPGVYNVSSGEPRRMRDLVSSIGDTLGRDPEALLRHGVERRQAPRMLVGDNGRILDAGWRPLRDVNVSISRYVESLSEER